MDYRKPSKEKANEAYLRTIGTLREENPYQAGRIQQQKLFLIICEGENTEPGYFDGFRVPTKTVIIERGCGSKTSLVNHALKIREYEEYEGREVWCVFDMDIKPDESRTQKRDFNNAIKKAEANGLKVAWSNDAFELWFVLHYQELETALTRHHLYPILKKCWALKSFSGIAKTEAFCKEHYERHGGARSKEQHLAIRRAQVLHKAYGGRRNYADQCPCTTVYLLVKELNKYLKG